MPSLSVLAPFLLGVSAYGISLNGSLLTGGSAASSAASPAVGAPAAVAEPPAPKTEDERQIYRAPLALRDLNREPERAEEVRNSLKNGASWDARFAARFVRMALTNPSLAQHILDDAGVLFLTPGAAVRTYKEIQRERADRSDDGLPDDKDKKFIRRIFDKLTEDEQEELMGGNGHD